MQVQSAKTAFLLIAIVLLFNSSISISQAQVRKVQRTQSPNSPVIFEIIQKDARPRAQGDEFLFFRLYESGRAEFEDWHQDSGSDPGFVMHRLKLSDEEMVVFISIAKRCLNLPNDFDPFQRLEEKVSITEIRIRAEDEYMRADIHNYIPENEKTEKYYPKQAKDLMQRVNVVRKKYHQEV